MAICIVNIIIYNYKQKPTKWECTNYLKTCVLQTVESFTLRGGYLHCFHLIWQTQIKFVATAKICANIFINKNV